MCLVYDVDSNKYGLDTDKRCLSKISAAKTKQVQLPKSTL
jgi:hypothetical protein